MHLFILYPAVIAAVVAILALFFNKEIKENDYTKDWINSFSSASSEFISHLVQRNRAQQELSTILGKLGSLSEKERADVNNKSIERWEKAQEDFEKKLYNHLTELIRQEALIKLLLASSDKIKKHQEQLLIQCIEKSEEWCPGYSLTIDAERICEVSSGIIKDEWIRIKKHSPIHNSLSFIIKLIFLSIFILLFVK